MGIGQRRHRGSCRGRWAAAIALCGLGLLLVVAPARASFGFESVSSAFSVGGEAPGEVLAGSHPEAWTATVSFPAPGSTGEETPHGGVRNLRIALPPGVLGAPGLLPVCRSWEFSGDACPAETAVGSVVLRVANLPTLIEAPVHLLDPVPGIPAQLGFHAKEVPLIVDLMLSRASPYGLVAAVENASQAGELLSLSLTLDGVVGDAPFLTLPRACPSPLVTSFAASPWGAPGVWVSAQSADPQTVVGCGSLAYRPALTAAPTTDAAAAPTGLDVEFDAGDPGLGSAGGRAAAETAAATLALPPGMTANPPAAAGLEGCTPSQLAAEAPDPDPATGCPGKAKIGSATATTPLLGEPLSGGIYLAQPDDPATTAVGAENPSDSLLGLYLVLRDPERGILLSFPIRIDADPRSGRLSAGFDQIPELSLDHLSLRFGSGPRAPLSTPPRCGTYALGYSLTPSSGNPPLGGAGTFATNSECDRDFAPGLSAGTASNAAGSAAPFVLDLRNASGAPNLAGLRLDLPPGLAADLAAVATCPERAATTGACPPASRLGYARIALGSGPEPLWVPGGTAPDSDVFLAGPFGGAPFSLLVSVPAAAGRFDLGRVVLRAPVRIDPRTARLSVELDDLPQIRSGIPLHYRALRLVLDRPGFLRNPTSCRSMPIELAATAASGETANVTERFQAADCGALAFRPRLSVHMSGGLGRNGHPRLELRFAPRPGQANLEKATLDLPAGQLLDTRNIRALCAGGPAPALCPAASRLGWASLWSPLLPAALRGPVYLRAPEQSYPELIAELRGGGLRFMLHARTGSAPGGRLRIRLSGIPDIPLSRASLVLAGGRRGIVVNSASLCSHRRRALSRIESHNGRNLRLRPRVRLDDGC